MFTQFCKFIIHLFNPKIKASTSARAGAMDFTIKIEYFVDIRDEHLVLFKFVWK